MKTKKKIINRLSAAVLSLVIVFSQFAGTAPWGGGSVFSAAETSSPIALRRINGSGEAFIYHSFHETKTFTVGQTYAFLNGIYSADDAVSALGSGAILEATDTSNTSLIYINRKYGKDATVKTYVNVITPGKDFDNCPFGGLYVVPNSGTPTEYRYFCWWGGAQNCGPYYAYNYVEESVEYTDVSATLNSIENQGSTNPEDYTVSITYNGDKTTTLDSGSYTVKFTAPDTVTFVISDSVGNSVTANFRSPLAIRYDGNNESAANLPETQAVWKGNSIKISAQKPTRRGYAFQNWKDKTTGTVYSSGVTVSPTSSLYLLAQWKDSQAPSFVYSPTQVMTGDSVETVKDAVKAALTITDNEPVSECTVTVTVSSDFTKTPGSKNVTVKVTDKAGNTATKTCTVYVASYVDISTPVFTKNTANLTATLNNPGTDTVTESGFVWGVMNSPTLTVNNGKAKTSTVASKAGDKISVTAGNLQKGVTYYARAYITAGGITYYSKEIEIGLGLPEYGTFTVTNNNNNTFTVKRTGGSEGAQTVYFRTVNGSAVGGTHFTHKSGTLTFGAGETSKTITITEKTANTAYSGKPATAYSNANRTYSVEIYRVVGGGSLGRTTSATRTMESSDDYKVSKSVYDTIYPRSVSLNDSNKWVSDHSGTGNWKIYFQNDRNKNTDQLNFHVQRSIDNPYLKNTATGFLYQAQFDYTEEDEGYHLAWVADHWPSNISGYENLSSAKALPLGSDCNFGTAKFTSTWESGKNATVVLPAMSGASNTKANGGMTLSKTTETGRNEWVKFDKGSATAHVWFSAAGSGEDKWYMTKYTDYLIVQDNQEPQFVAVAPMAGGTYKIGDKFVVSLIFDEIVDSVYSSLSRVSVNTSWGTATYTGGANTNVLYFTGTVANEPTDTTLTVNSIVNPTSIKDLCNTATYTATGSGSGTTTATVDTSVPNFTVTSNGITNGTGKATITVNEVKTKTTGMSYAWSDSSTAPTTGWVELSSSELTTAKNSGLSLSIRKEAGSGAENGKWYLHVKAVYSTTGASAYKYTCIDFGTAANPASGSTQPTLTVTADNTNWAASRKINISSTGAQTLKYRKSGVTSWTTLSTTATGVTVTENGYYTFLLTAGDDVITKTVQVEKIDRENPTASVGEPTDGTVESEKSGVYTKIVLPITYSDAHSGVKTVQYAWTDSTSTPTSWSTLQTGAATVTYTAGESVPTTKYLHIRVYDYVNHTYMTRSLPYTVISQTAANNHVPTVTVTGAPTAWTNDMATLTWTLSDYEGKNYEVILPDGKTTADTSGEIWTKKNGTYTVTVRDLDYGGEKSATIKVDKLDFTPPTVTVSGITDGWKKSNQTLTVTASDSQSGVGKKWYKIVSDTDEIPTEGLSELTGNTITVSEEGEYYIYYKVYDNAGDVETDREANKTEGFRLVRIDKTAPEISFGDYSVATGMTVTVKDGTSGLSSVTYQISNGTETLKTGTISTNGKTDADFTLTGLPVGDVRVTVTAVDNAGNIFVSYKDIHIDVVSVDITWSDMEFTYSDGTWNTSTHTYDGIGWAPDKADGNKITVRNSGDIEINVSYGYTSATENVSGSFTDSVAAITAPVAIPAEEERAAWLILNGKPTESMNKAILGSVTVTIGGE